MEIKVTSRKWIKPAIPTPNHLRKMKLSCIDQIAPAAFGTFNFFYSANGDVSISDEKDERIDQLERSLSELLTLFYPMAGRYDDDSNSIDCNDQGAEFIQTRVHEQLDRYLLEEAGTEINCFCPFEDEMSGFSPVVLIVQVHVFDCGGLAINVNLSHKIADACALFNFVKAWATASRVGINDVLPPDFGLGSLLPATQKEVSKIVVPLFDGAKMVTKRFAFSGEAISALKAKAVAEDYSGLKRQPSRVQVVMALAWKARIAVARAKHGHLRPSLLTTALNLRGRTALKLPENCVGNAVKMVIARFIPNDETELKLPNLLSILGNAMRSAAADCARAENAEDVFQLVNSAISEIRESAKNNEADIVLFTSLCRFPRYETDFGWGKPAWVGSVAKPSELVQLMDTKCGEGIEVWVTLEEQEMLQFQQDQDIVAYTCNPKTTA